MSLVNGTHSAGAEGFAQLEVVVETRRAKPLATLGTGHACKRFGIADANRCAAVGARNRVRIAHFCDSNIVNDTAKPSRIQRHPGRCPRAAGSFSREDGAGVFPIANSDTYSPGAHNSERSHSASARLGSTRRPHCSGGTAEASDRS